MKVDMRLIDSVLDFGTWIAILVIIGVSGIYSRVYNLVTHCRYPTIIAKDGKLTPRR